MDDYLFNNKSKKNTVLDKGDEKSPAMSGFWQPSYEKLNFYFKDWSSRKLIVEQMETID